MRANKLPSIWRYIRIQCALVTFLTGSTLYRNVHVVTIRIAIDSGISFISYFHEIKYVMLYRINNSFVTHIYTIFIFLYA